MSEYTHSRHHEALACLGLVTPTLDHFIKFNPDLALMVHRTAGTPDATHAWSARLVEFADDILINVKSAIGQGSSPQDAINALELTLVMRSPDEAIKAYHQFFERLGAAQSKVKDLPPLFKTSDFFPDNTPPAPKPPLLTRVLDFFGV